MYIVIVNLSPIRRVRLVTRPPRGFTQSCWASVSFRLRWTRVLTPVSLMVWSRRPSGDTADPTRRPTLDPDVGRRGSDHLVDIVGVKARRRFEPVQTRSAEPEGAAWRFFSTGTN